MSDVIIVGAGCAGAATAMLLARRGHRVLLVDRATFPHPARTMAPPEELLRLRAEVRGSAEATRRYFLMSQGVEEAPAGPLEPTR